MLKTAAGIVKEEGFLRLWRGITPAIYRHAIYTGVRFGAYEKMRENVFQKNPDGTYSLWYKIVENLQQYYLINLFYSFIVFL